MNKFLTILIILQIALLPQSAISQDKISTQNKIIKFQLASFDGEKFISQNDFLGKKTMIIFFSLDCPPCIKKLANLSEKEFNYQEINIGIINLDNSFESKDFINKLNFNKKITILQSSLNPKALLRKFGNYKSQLPFVVLLGKEANLCETSTELFNEQQIKNCS